MARERASVHRLLSLLLLVLAGCSGTSQKATNAPLPRTSGADQLACMPSGCDPRQVGVIVLPAGHGPSDTPSFLDRARDRWSVQADP